MIYTCRTQLEHSLDITYQDGLGQNWKLEMQMVLRVKTAVAWD